MKITIENTDKIVHLDGVPGRVWEGKTEAGVKVICFITRIAVAEGEDHHQFQKELEEVRPPSREAEMFPTKLIL